MFSLKILAIMAMLSPFTIQETKINVHIKSPVVQTLANTIDAPLVKQLPELPRGCEVTSLAMLLRHAGVDVDKMTLANQIHKVPFQYGKYHGDPNDGFVGNMYTYNEPGYGVYHQPIFALAEHYLPGRMKDLTGYPFEVLMHYLNMDRPVWVVTNTRYDRLADNQFHQWTTINGKLNITYKLHSVLMTGYDDEYIYFNDPLEGIKNKKILKENFLAAWTQMGQQAITYY
jgi:uncharacterized protein YvpB